MGISRVSQKNSYKLMGIMDFPITFGRNGYGCVETLITKLVFEAVD